MWFSSVGNLIAHARFKLETATVLQFGHQGSCQAKQDMPLFAPVVGQIAWRIFHHSYSDGVELLSSPSRLTRCARVNSRLDC